MAKVEDTLPRQENPDRVNYVTGVLLGAEDFQAEQDYHRGRLARALAYAMGHGTLAGLEVSHHPAQAADATIPPAWKGWWSPRGWPLTGLAACWRCRVRVA